VQGTPRTLGGKDSFEASDSTRVWVVRKGAIDLFSQQEAGESEDDGDGGHRGRRRFMFRVEAGSLLRGFDTDGLAPVAVPTNGSEIVESGWDETVAANRDESLRNHLASALDGWLSVLGVALVGDDLPPRGARTMRVGEIVLEEADSLQVDGHVWLTRMPEGSTVGGRDISPRANAPVPLPSTAWFTAAAAGTITAITTGRMLAIDPAAADTRALQDAVLAAVAERVQARLEGEARRVRTREALRQRTLAATVTQLVSITKESGGAAAVDTAHALESVVSLVADAMSIKIDIQRDTTASPRDPLSALLRRADLHQRAVTLMGEWWTQDIGPLVAFLGSWDKPCAILPRGPESYVLVEGATGRQREVTAKVAAELSPRAFILYRPLPEGDVSPADMIRLGFPQPRRDIFTIFAAAGLFGLLSLLTPLFAGEITETVIPEARLNQLGVLILALVAAAFAGGGFALVQSVAILRLEGRADSILQAAVWDRLMRAPVSFFRRFTVGDLNARAFAIDGIRRIVSAQVVTAILSATTGIFSLGLMFYYDLLLSALVMVILLFWIWLNMRLAARLADVTAERLTLDRLQLTKAYQFVGGINKLRASGSEEFAFGIWSRAFAGIAKLTVTQFVVRRRMAVLQSTLAMLTTTVVIAVLAIQGDQLFTYFDTAFTWDQIRGESLANVMPMADFIGFNVALGQVMMAAQSLANAWTNLVTIKPTYAQLDPIMKIESETVAGAEDPGDLQGEIEVANVHFRYDADGPLILNGLTLTIEAGQHVAIVGASGCGKSTLVRVLLGFEEIERGTVFLDGHDLRRLDKQAVRRNIGVVLQNGRLLTGSIFENIVAGASLTEEDAWDAVAAAGLEEDLKAMPMGMHTVLAEGASTISGGQRQRLMIARAIVHKPRILIFDEATSALDNRTQAIVTSSLDAMQCTRISIAHRLSTIRHADKIVVVDRGVVIEQGNFDDLMDADGAFAELARRQIAEG
ncbi:MAG: NHLP bacteriocin export ABC transporter permease/ATPase subunit, partial [Rhodospirillaceae bacterium]|nr:NHLP bacteriocin export ABC transporter permease/ATPase subunit [Rhodospirillaceae bacterium]